MNKTVYEQGIEQGIKRGRLTMVISLIERRFQPVSEELRNRLEQMTMDELMDLVIKISNAKSLAELGLAGAESDT